MKKIFLLIGFVILLTGCSATSQKEENPKPVIEEGLPVFTIQELAKFDGKNGNKAYVAVEGIVYEVTNVKPWANGNHNGNTAGKDLTAAIAKAPHGMSTLEDLPIVGTLTD